MQLPDDLKQLFHTKARTDPGFAIAAAIADLASAQRGISNGLDEIRRLDFHIAHHAKAVDGVAGSISDIHSGLGVVGDAITELATSVDRLRRPETRYQQEPDKDT